MCLEYLWFQIDAPVETENDVESDAHSFEATSPEKGFKGEWEEIQVLTYRYCGDHNTC